MTFIRGTFRTRAEVEKKYVRTLNLTWKNQIKTASLEHRRTRYQNHFHSASFRIAEANELQPPNCNESVRSLQYIAKHRSHIGTSPLPTTLRFHPEINTQFDWLIFGSGRESISSFPKYIFTAKKKKNRNRHSWTLWSKTEQNTEKLTTWKTWPFERSWLEIYRACLDWSSVGEPISSADRHPHRYPPDRCISLSCLQYTQYEWHSWGNQSSKCIVCIVFSSAESTENALW